MNRLVKNASWLIGCKLVQQVLGLIISMMSARYLGPSNYGLINYASSIIAFVTPFTMMGLSNVLVQELVADEKDEGRVLGTSLVSCTVTALLGILTTLAFVTVFNAGQTETLIVVGLYSIILLTQAWEILQYWFQAKLLSKYYAVVSLISYTIVSAYKIYLLATGKSVYWFAVSYALDYLIIAVLLLICYRRLGGRKLSFSFAKLKDMFSHSRYYIISSLMVTFCVQTDKIMLSAMIDDAATGYYSAASVCAGLTSFIFTAITDSFRPVVLQNKQIDQQSFERSVKNLYCIMIYLSLAQCIGITVLARPIIALTYGAEYAPSVPMLRICSWYTAFSCLGVVRNIWILAEKKQKYLWVINLTGAVTNVVLNCLLIPAWGGNGAALASLITQIIMNIVVGFVLKPIRPNNRLMFNALNPKLLVGMAKQMKMGEK